MILDSSVLVAIALDEPERPADAKPCTPGGGSGGRGICKGDDFVKTDLSLA